MLVTTPTRSPACSAHADPSFTQRTYIHAPDLIRFDTLDLGLAEDNQQDNEQAESGGSA